MKISKHKIKLLVAEAMRKSIKEEKSADQSKGSSASDNAKKIQVEKSDAVYNELMNQLNNIDVESDLLRTHVSQLVAAMRMYVDFSEGLDGETFKALNKGELSTSDFAFL